MDDQGLHPALLPADTLAEPGGEFGGRLFAGFRRECANSRASDREADAEIRVFGDVPGVPAADPSQRLDAKMIGGAPERDRQIERREAGIDEIEERGVFDGEHRAEPGVAVIFDRQRRLQAVD